MNTFTTNDQRDPSLCRDGRGNFVVIWESHGGQDGDADGVFAQRFAQDGGRLGTEFQVNTFTTGDQFDPGICCDLAGNFVTVWQSFAQDGSYNGVFGQRFLSTGAKAGSEFEVNSFTTGPQQEPVVTCDSAGNFVVVWESGSNYYGGPPQDGSGSGVFGQRFANSGTMLGTEFQVNTYTTYDQREPNLTHDAAGNFVVVWSSGTYYGPGPDGDGKGVFGQRFANTGAPVGSEFQVNTYTTATQNDPGLCSDAAGNFVVVWQSGSYSGATQDGSGLGIFAQRFANSGAALGSEFQINTFTSNQQTEPIVSCDSGGKFVVVWSSRSQDGNRNAAIARAFNSAGVATSGEIQVNSYTTGDQQDPMVALGDNGGFIVVWESDPNDRRIPQQPGAPGGIGQDGDGDGVFAKGFAPLQPAPTLSPLGLVIAALALLVTGCITLVVRRRRNAEEHS